jgi:hypothetical protein
MTFPETVPVENRAVSLITGTLTTGHPALQPQSTRSRSIQAPFAGICSAYPQRKPPEEIPTVIVIIVHRFNKRS